MMEAVWSARRVDRQLGRSDCASTASSAAIQEQVAPSLGVPVSSRTIRRCLAEGHFGSWRPLCVLPLTLTHRRLRSEWCHAREKWTAGKWKYVILSDESRFNLSCDDNRVCVWRPRCESLNPTFTLQRHTASSVEVSQRVSHSFPKEGLSIPVKYWEENREMDFPRPSETCLIKL
ncbi:transposable element Tcb1 transposase [Trichonephila clavipes]|nr:transposable element Tcb1 transposase [Trichonephila clavipes]